MNKQKLLDLINNPAGLTQSDVNELLEITADYPYFQLGHALIAKFKADHKALDANTHLHLASIATPNRNSLKALIEGKLDNESVTADTTPQEGVEVANDNSSVEVETAEVEPTVIEEEVESKTTNEETSAVDETPVIEEKEIETKEEEPTPAIEKEVMDEAKAEQDKIDETPIGEVNIKSADTSSDKLKFDVKETEKPAEDDKDSIYRELEENLRSLQRRRSGESEKTETKEEVTEPTAAKVETPKPVTRKKTATTKAASSTSRTRKSTTTKSTARKTTAAKTSTRAKSSSSAKPTTRASKTTGTKATTTPAKRAATTKKTPSTRKSTSTKAVSTKVTSTKKTITPKSTASTKATSTAKKKLQKKVNSPVKSTKSTNSTGTGKTRSKKDQSEIIENFIKKEPSISKPKSANLKTDAQQEDLSLDSVEIKEDLISENLAIIMEKQGKTQKAKDIYKKLIWKFPQKKAYFASRIEELDKS